MTGEADMSMRALLPLMLILLGWEEGAAAHLTDATNLSVGVVYHGGSRPWGVEVALEWLVLVGDTCQYEEELCREGNWWGTTGLRVGGDWRGAERFDGSLLLLGGVSNAEIHDAGFQLSFAALGGLGGAVGTDRVPGLLGVITAAKSLGWTRTTVRPRTVERVAEGLSWLSPNLGAGICWTPGAVAGRGLLGLQVPLSGWSDYTE